MDCGILGGIPIKECLLPGFAEANTRGDLLDGDDEEKDIGSVAHNLWSSHTIYGAKLEIRVANVEICHQGVSACARPRANFGNSPGSDQEF
jgi:hypothetical protein